MSIFNRRNAILGFLVWRLVKRSVRKRVPDVRIAGGSNERPWGRWLVIGFVGVLVGAFFGGLAWRRRSSSEIELSEFEASQSTLADMLPPDVPAADEPGMDEGAADASPPETADTSAE